MRLDGKQFNLYLVMAMLAALGWGCKSTEPSRKKDIATLRVHLEVAPDATDLNQVVSIPREQPINFNVEKQPFLTEAQVKEAKLVPSLAGFALYIQFDHQGSGL